jgi:hypothetical protein
VTNKWRTSLQAPGHGKADDGIPGCRAMNEPTGLQAAAHERGAGGHLLRCRSSTMVPHACVGALHHRRRSRRSRHLFRHRPSAAHRKMCRLWRPIQPYLPGLTAGPTNCSPRLISSATICPAGPHPGNGRTPRCVTAGITARSLLGPARRQTSTSQVRDGAKRRRGATRVSAWLR